MKYEVFYTSRMKKEIKIMKKRGKDLSKLGEVIKILSSGETLPEKYKDHQLTGNYCMFRECHIEPDWLLFYQIEEDVLILSLSRTGSHSDLF